MQCQLITPVGVSLQFIGALLEKVGEMTGWWFQICVFYPDPWGHDLF